MIDLLPITIKQSKTASYLMVLLFFFLVPNTNKIKNYDYQSGVFEFSGKCNLVGC